MASAPQTSLSLSFKPLSIISSAIIFDLFSSSSKSRFILPKRNCSIYECIELPLTDASFLILSASTLPTLCFQARIAALSSSLLVVDRIDVTLGKFELSIE